MSWLIVFTKQARKDAKKLASSLLRPEAQRLLDVLASDPFRNPTPFQELLGDLEGAYSRRINIQHRVVYQAYATERTVKVLRMWTHHE